MGKKNIPLIVLVILLIVGGVVYLTLRRSPPKMNVLLITLDTTRADRLGCYGYNKPISPNLDQLAAESAVFELAISQAAVTPVSHASILTGLEPYNHGLRVLHGLVANRLDDNCITLPEVWQKSGGQTAAFVSAFPVTASFGLHQGFDHFDAQFQQADGQGLVSQKGTVNTGKSQRRANATTTAAIEWLEKKANPKKPLLMWVHYFDPHDPFLLPPEHILNKFHSVSEKKDDLLRAIYDCEVFFMDSQIGRLLEAFKTRGIWDNTIVVVVADHGEGLGEHNWWTHGILYQEQIKVPQIIRIPGMREGRRITSLVRTIDLMPTILDMTEISPSLWPEMDGISLRDAMSTGHTKEELSAYSDSVNILNYGRWDDARKTDHKYDKLYCLIQGNYKLIYHQLKPEETEFYDLSTDPKELNNLTPSNLPEMHALITRLKGLSALSDIMPGMTSSDMERVRKLKSLGYVQ